MTMHMATNTTGTVGQKRDDEAERRLRFEAAVRDAQTLAGLLIAEVATAPRTFEDFSNLVERAREIASRLNSARYRLPGAPDDGRRASRTIAKLARLSGSEARVDVPAE
jgi:hypothetical protein